jgi:hypothetical protein
MLLPSRRGRKSIWQAMVSARRRPISSSGKAAARYVDIFMDCIR